MPLEIKRCNFLGWDVPFNKRPMKVGEVSSYVYNTSPSSVDYYKWGITNLGNGRVIFLHDSPELNTPSVYEGPVEMVNSFGQPDNNPWRWVPDSTKK